MSVKEITSRQIFGMKRESVEKRIEEYFEETKDAATVLQFVFALLLRNALTVTDFSGMLTTIVQQILLYSQPDDTLRALASFFKSYFSGGDWKQVMTRLFDNEKNYHSYDTAISHYKEFLFEKTTPIEELEDQQYKLTSIFLKENKKTQAWSLRDADPYLSEEKVKAILELLSLLTVFEKDGVRLFVEVVSSDVMNCTRHSLIKKSKAPKKGEEFEELEVVEEKKLPFRSTLADLIQSATNEETIEELEEKQIALPAGIKLENLNSEELLEIVKEQLPEEATLTDLRLVSEEESEQEEILPSDDSKNLTSKQADHSLMSALMSPPKDDQKPVKGLLDKKKPGIEATKKMLNDYHCRQKKSRMRKRRK